MKRTSAGAAVNIGLALSVAASGPACNVFAAGPSQQPSAGLLVQAPPMSAARAAHTATALSDGRVLIAGGFAEEGSANGAEVYEPGTQRFSQLPAMITSRHSHTATVLPDGKVLIVGGYGVGTTTLATAEIFDPATNSFAPTGSLLAARANHIAILLENGNVLVAGGVAPGLAALSSAELYDPVTGRFSSAGSMTVAREAHVAARLRDSRIVIVGGRRGRGADITLYSSAETYDPATGVFTRVGDMRIRRHKHDAVLLPDGEVLVIGGSDERDDRGTYDSSELFDPKSGTFTAGPSMKLRRFKHGGSSVVLPSGLVLIAGGATQAETYDPLGHRFVLVGGDARMAGQFSATAPLQSGEALITGGYGNGNGPRTSAWLYKPTR
jgi:hypothetical protein